MLKYFIGVLLEMSLEFNRVMQPLYEALSFDVFVVGLVGVFLSYHFLIAPWFGVRGSDKASGKRENNV